MINVVTVSTKAPGGIRSVVQNMIESGIYTRLDIKHQWIYSHDNFFLSKIILTVWSAIQIAITYDGKSENVLHLHTSHRGSIYRKLLLVNVGTFIGYRIVIHIHGSEFQYEYESRSLIYKFAVERLLGKSNVVVVFNR